MSVFAVSPMASDWQPHRFGSRPGLLGSGTEEIGLGIGLGRIQTSTLERPPLKSHRSFPNTLSASYPSSDGPNRLNEASRNATQEGLQSTTAAEQKRSTVSPQQVVQTTYGGSAPASPLPQVSPPSAEGEHDEQQEDDDVYALMGEEGEDDGGENQNGHSKEKTAEQRRADKRKMKRFR